MKKIFFTLFALTIFSTDCFAMTFSQPVKIGGIGFRIQAPYHGYEVDGATKNNGESYFENGKLIKTPFYTYTKGIAQWGTGNNALFCNYLRSTKENGSFIKFGGKNNYVVSLESQYKKIYKIDTNEGLTLYSIVRISGTERINIIGRQKNGKWVSYVDSETLTNKYFSGKQAYKAHDGVHYGEPLVQKDTIVIPYKYQLQFRVAAEGEFRFKWDDAAQWFGIEQVVY